MLEILFLLLPVAASYGWLMGYRASERKIEKHNETKSVNSPYFTGLNYILRNQQGQEKSNDIDKFILSLDVNPATIDTHMTLGHLFRQRGDIQRSIRVHQNIIAQPNLDKEKYHQALTELGQDYNAAGFYDRSEEIFIKLVALKRDNFDAEKQLLRCYQTTKSWQKGIDAFTDFSKPARLELNRIIAHFHCELAEEIETLAGKETLYQLALKTDKHCDRAWYQLAILYDKNQQPKKVKHAIGKIFSSNIHRMVELLPLIERTYQNLNEPVPYQQLLQKTKELGGGASIINALAKLHQQQGDTQLAKKKIMEQLYHSPSLKNFHHLMKLHISDSENEKEQTNLIELERLVEQHIEAQPHYVCMQCGFSMHALSWECPSCHEWSSIQRAQGLNGE